MRPRLPQQPDIVIRPSGNKGGRLFVLMIFALLLAFLLPSKELIRKVLPPNHFVTKDIQVDFEEISANSVTWRISGQLYNQGDEDQSAPDLEIALQDSAGTVIARTRVPLQGREIAANGRTGFTARIETAPGITLKPVITMIGPRE